MYNENIKIKEFIDEPTTKAIDDMLKFINENDVEYISHSHAYKFSKPGFMNFRENSTITIIMVYKTK